MLRRLLLALVLLPSLAAAAEPIDWMVADGLMERESYFEALDLVSPALRADDAAIRRRARGVATRALIEVRETAAARALLREAIADAGEPVAVIEAYEQLIRLTDDETGRERLFGEAIAASAAAPAAAVARLRRDYGRQLLKLERTADALIQFDLADQALPEAEDDRRARREVRVDLLLATRRVKDGKRAEAELRALIDELGPTDPETRLALLMKLGRCIAAAWDLPRCADHYAGIAAACPGLDQSEAVNTRIWQAKILAKAKRTAEAEAVLLEADRSYPDARLIRRCLVNWDLFQLYRRSGRMDEADRQVLVMAERYDQRLAQAATMTPAELFLIATQCGSLFAEGGHPEIEARHLAIALAHVPERAHGMRRALFTRFTAALRKAVARFGDVPATRGQLAAVLATPTLARDQLIEAADVLLDLAPAIGDDASVAITEAMVHELLAPIPNPLLAGYASLGMAKLLHRADRHEAAIATCRLLLADPSNGWCPEALLLIGQIQAKLRQEVQALATLADLAARFPGSDAARGGDCIVAWIDLLQGRKAEAIARLERVAGEDSTTAAADKARRMLDQLRAR